MRGTATRPTRANHAKLTCGRRGRGGSARGIHRWTEAACTCRALHVLGAAGMCRFMAPNFVVSTFSGALVAVEAAAFDSPRPAARRQGELLLTSPIAQPVALATHPSRWAHVCCRCAACSVHGHRTIASALTQPPCLLLLRSGIAAGRSCCCWAQRGGCRHGSWGAAPLRSWCLRPASQQLQPRAAPAPAAWLCSGTAARWVWAPTGAMW